MIKKIGVIIFFVFLLILGIYLNRSYAYIYHKIGDGNLAIFESNKEYIINKNMQNSKTLIYAALGDSLTAGAGVDNYEQSFPYLVSEKLGYNQKVILKSRAILGYKSIDLKNVLLPLAINDNPDIVTILIGVNDVHNFIDKKEFEKNYDEVLKQLTQKTSAKINVINIPYIGSKNLIFPPYNLYIDSQTKEYNKIIKTLAQKYNLKYIDLYTESLKEFKRSDTYYSNDLFHPSAKGYALWADIIYANLSK